jgi:hypothetical protein
MNAPLETIQSTIDELSPLLEDCEAVKRRDGLRVSICPVFQEAVAKLH